MRKLLFALLIFPLITAATQAQETPIADVAAGYSVIQVVKGFSLTANGGSGSAALNITRWFGVAGDLGIYHATAGAGLTALTYTAGPRFSYRHWKAVTPFGQVLLGGAHVVSTSQATYNGPSNAFALGIGGGADFGLGSSGRFALRPQVEYFGFGLPSDFGFGNATGTVRVSVGLVYRIARK
jgi:hypothetical protein